MKAEIDKAKEEADKAAKLIDNYQNLSNDNPLFDICDVLQRKNADDVARIKKQDKKSDVKEEKNKKSDFVTNTMSGLSRKERKVVERILDIVIKNAPRDIAEIITAKVKEEFK